MGRRTISVEIIITDHAFDRAKERLGLSKTAFEKLSLKAFVAGKKHSDCKGHLRKHIDALWFRHKSNNARVYGESLFIFSGNTLITVYQLPNNLKPLAR